MRAISGENDSGNSEVNQILKDIGFVSTVDKQ